MLISTHAHTYHTPQAPGLPYVNPRPQAYHTPGSLAFEIKRLAISVPCASFVVIHTEPFSIPWCVVGGVEVCGGRGGGVWWEGWRCVVGGVEVCDGRGGGVWWEGWRCVMGGVEVCDGRGGGV